MTTEEAIKALKLMNLKSVHPFLHWEEMLEVRDMAIDALREQEERDNPKPLTLDELREMRYGWVWAISNDPDLTVSGWAYISETGAITIWEYKPDSIVGNVQLRWKDYGKTWLAYRHKPKEDLHG